MFVPLHDANNSIQRILWPYVTHLIIAINVLVYLAISAMPDVQSVASVIALSYKPDGLPAEIPETLRQVIFEIPAPLGILTSMFLHADFMHLVGNMLFLYVFGDNVEDAMGHWRFAVFYLVCGVVAALVQDWLTEPGWIFYGASGATSGVVAAFVMLHPRVRVWVLVLMRIPLPIPALWMLVVWLAFQIYNAFGSGSDATVAWWAHLAGAAVGAALLLLMKQRGVPLFDKGLPTSHDPPG